MEHVNCVVHKLLPRGGRNGSGNDTQRQVRNIYTLGEEDWVPLEELREQFFKASPGHLHEEWGAVLACLSHGCHRRRCQEVAAARVSELDLCCLMLGARYKCALEQYITHKVSLDTRGVSTSVCINC